MKRQFSLLLLFLSLTITHVYAQGEAQIGIKAGVTSANITGSDVNQLSSNGSPATLEGFNFGVFVNSKIARNFWIKSELLTIQKGAVLQTKDASGTSTQSNFKSSYIDLYPISPTFHWRGFQLLAGPYVSMLLKSSIQDSSVFGSPSNLSIYRQKLDAGIVLGAEYEFKERISIGVRYTKGFVPLFEQPGSLVNAPGKTPAIQNIYNESISISIGYALGKRAGKADNKKAKSSK
jgi:hypothetical protein